MNSQLSTSFLCVQCFIFLVVLNICPSLAIIRTDPPLYTSCGSRFSCGNITVGYPFWGGNRPFSCGHPGLMLKCDPDYDPLYATTIIVEDINYHVLNIDEKAQTLTIVRQSIHSGGICFLALYDQHVNTIIDDDVFDYSAGYENVTISSGCPFSATHPGRFPCDEDAFLLTGANVSGACNKSITVPVSTNLIQAAKGDLSLLAKAVNNGFELKWKLKSRECADCRNSSGSCGFDDGLICYCPNWPNLTHDLSGSVCANSSHATPTPPLSEFLLHQWQVVQVKAISNSVMEGCDGVAVWKRPHSDFWKLNVDAAMIAQSMGIGFGLVVRNDQGHFVGARSGVLASQQDPRLAEALSFREALSWIKAKGWSHVEIESDCLDVVAAIRSSFMDYSYFGSVIFDYRVLLSSLPSCKVFFIRRTANEVAHLLVRAASSESGVREWESVPPSFIMDALLFDLI